MSDVGLYRVGVDDGVVVSPVAARVAVVREVRVGIPAAAAVRQVAADDGRLCRAGTIVVQLQDVRH